MPRGRRPRGQGKADRATEASVLWVRRHWDVGWTFPWFSSGYASLKRGLGLSSWRRAPVLVELWKVSEDEVKEAFYPKGGALQVGFSACRYQEVLEGFSSVSRMMILCWVLKETGLEAHSRPARLVPRAVASPPGTEPGLHGSHRTGAWEPGCVAAHGCLTAQGVLLQVKGSGQMIWVSVSCRHVSQSPAHRVPTGASGARQCQPPGPFHAGAQPSRVDGASCLNGAKTPTAPTTSNSAASRGHVVSNDRVLHRGKCPERGRSGAVPPEAFRFPRQRPAHEGQAVGLSCGARPAPCHLVTHFSSVFGQRVGRAASCGGCRAGFRRRVP